MSRRKSRHQRERGLHCALMPGECFKTQAEAEEMRLTRQINVAVGGMVQATYHIEKCLCGRYHLITEQHLSEWKARKS